MTSVIWAAVPTELIGASLLSVGGDNLFLLLIGFKYDTQSTIMKKNIGFDHRW